jgi:hypothetical protein
MGFGRGTSAFNSSKYISARDPGVALMALYGTQSCVFSDQTDWDLRYLSTTNSTKRRGERDIVASGDLAGFS